MRPGRKSSLRGVGGALGALGALGTRAPPPRPTPSGPRTAKSAPSDEDSAVGRARGRRTSARPSDEGGEPLVTPGRWMSGLLIKRRLSKSERGCD